MNASAWFGIVAAAVCVGGVLSSIFHSLKELSRIGLEELAASMNRPSKIRQVQKIVDDVEGHSNAVALPRIACNLISAVAAVFWVAALQGRDTPQWPDAIIGVLATSVLVWIFGMLIPQSVARHAGEGTVYFWSATIRLIYILSGPFKLLGDFLDEVVRRLTGKERTSEAEDIEEELLQVVEEAKQEGQFDESERDMIGAVVRFRNLKVVQIMTPRTEIEALEVTNNLGEVTGYVRKSGHSRVPVYEDNLDHIVGVFYVKDLMRWLAGERTHGAAKGFDLRSILRPALFVPESKTVRELMQELLSKKVHIAIVADEFGGTAGLVTIEDIMEEIVGEIQDEYEKPDDAIPEVKLNVTTRSATIDARAYITDVNAALRPLGIEIPESEEYDTVGGFVTVTLGRIPAKGDDFREGPMLVTILDAEPTRVKAIELRITTQEQTPQPNASTPTGDPNTNDETETDPTNPDSQDPTQDQNDPQPTPREPQPASARSSAK
jgi:putative hemolysin